MRFYKFNDPNGGKTSLINLDLMRRIDWNGDDKLIFCDINGVCVDIVFPTVEEAKQALTYIHLKP